MFIRPRSELWNQNSALSADASASFADVEADLSDDGSVIESPDWNRGEPALNQGDLGTAIQLFEATLILHRQHVPYSVGNCISHLIWEVLRHVVGCILGRFSVGWRAADSGTRELITARHLARLSFCYWRSDNLIAALWAHFRLLNIAEKYSPSLERSYAYAQHALLMEWLGWFRRGRFYAESSVAMSQPLKSVAARAFAQYAHGTLLHASSRWAESITACRSAVTLFEEVGLAEDANTSRCRLAGSYFSLGRIPEAVEEATLAYQSSNESLTRAQALAIWAVATDGDIPVKVSSTKGQSSDHDPESRVRLLQAEGFQLLYLQQSEEAIETFAEGCMIARTKMLGQDYLIPCQLGRALALRGLVECYEDLENEEVTTLLREATRYARRGLRTARRFQNYLPHALRESAILSALRGRTKRAIRLFEESLDVANRQHANYEYAQTLAARGHMGKRFQWQDAGDDVDDGEYMRDRLKHAPLLRARAEQ